MNIEVSKTSQRKRIRRSLKNKKRDEMTTRAFGYIKDFYLNIMMELVIER